MTSYITGFLTAALFLHAHLLAAQEPPVPAAVAQPTAKLQEEFLSWKFGLFLHFNIATFNGQEWANGYEDPATFAPDQLDCGQWADAARAAGMKYAVLTVKHTGGWCLWDSAYTTHDITAFKNYKGGKGDIVREFVDAFRQRGIKVGFYYCGPGDWDNNNGNSLKPGQTSLHGLPPESAGDYPGFVKKQFTELLTKYGPVDLVWFDAYDVKFNSEQWRDIKAHMKKLQPQCLVIANRAHDFQDTDIYGYEYPVFKDEKGYPPPGNTIPSEVCDTITNNDTWFWQPSSEPHLRSAENILAMLRKCNGLRANYLLNCAPDRHGRMPESFVNRLKETAELLKSKPAPTPPPAAARLSDAEIQTRVDGLVSRMTTEEKVHQLASTFPNANIRLQIPQLIAGEALHGVCASGATSFPQSIGLGATWDPDLIERIGQVIGKEGRALGIQQVFSPMLGLARDPRWGRVEESYGEDPYHVSRLAVAYINGVQGKGPDRLGPDHMACTPKHFVADGDSLRGGNGEAVDISETLLRETALVPFEAAVKEAHTASLMPAHHSLNGAPCHANTWLLTDVLRKEWGFDGMITSDALDIAKIHCFPGNPFYFARNYQHAGCLALEAGVDMELVCGNPWNSEMRTFGAQMVEAANAGKVSPAALDRAVGNVLRLKYHLGLFGQPIPKCYDPLLLVAAPQQDIKEFDEWAVAIREGKEVWGGVPPAPRADVKEVLTDKAHERLALEAAQKTITLLKNQGNLLPLDKSKLKSVAVIGPNADAVVLGNYSGSPRYGVSVLQGLRNYLGNSVAVKYAKGCDLKTDRQDAIAEAVTAAQGADVSILVVGTSIDTIRENLDRSDLSLPGAQEKLVEAVCATGKPVVVVLINGGALTIPWIAEHVPAILEGWYLGQEGGNAMAQALFGEVNPGGKLPVTFPSEVGMVPCYYNQLPAGGPRVYFKNGGETGFKVQYPFGYGLSYTTFSFGAPQLSRSNMTVNDSAVLTVTVTNTGTRSGDEVAQLYLNHRYGSKVRPEKELKGFQRITLKPGESRKLEFAIGFEQMKCWRNGKWTVEPGEYRLTVGADSASGQTLVLDVR